MQANPGAPFLPGLVCHAAFSKVHFKMGGQLLYRENILGATTQIVALYDPSMHFMAYLEAEQ